MRRVFLTLFLIPILFFTACGDEQPSASYTPREVGDIVVPSSPKTKTIEGGGFIIDISNVTDGYVAVSATQTYDKKIKVQIIKGEQKYNYDFRFTEEFEFYPLQMGDGTYSIAVYENIDGNRYAQVISGEAEVALKSEYAPFLIPNQYVDYDADTEAVKEAYSLTTADGTKLESVDAIYSYIVTNISYDNEKAATVTSGYLPNVDETLQTKKGICFDYAALTAAMLRSLGIPTRLVTGYVSAIDEYHAWNEIYIDEVGWVRSAIYFDGKTWQRADTTFAAAEGLNHFTGKGMTYSSTGIY